MASRLPTGVVVCLLVCGPAAAQEGIGEVFAADATVRGAVVLAGSGTRVLGGSSVTAGDSTALIRLTRGGEVRVCPGTSLTVTASAGRRELLWSMSSGAVELHYDLPALADTLMTPDFRLLLAGPGAFHLAIRSEARGNPCVRNLPENSASVIVYEQMGSGTYQVKSNEEVVFRDGRVAGNDPLAPPNCGCPPAVQPHVAEAPAQPAPEAEGSQLEAAEHGAAAMQAVIPRKVDASPAVAAPDRETKSDVALPVAAGAVDWSVLDGQKDVTAPPPAVEPGEVHVQVDAPFVFQAEEPVPERPALIARVSLPAWPRLYGGERVVSPPPAPSAGAAAPAQAERPRKKKGFFGFFRAIFAAIFGRK